MAASRPDDYRHPFVQQIVAALRKRCGVGRGDRVLLAISGGADSVALLRAMAIIAPRRPWQLELTVGHVQHHLREQAEADAQFVDELADELDISFYRQDIQPGRVGPDEESNIESRARSMRYDALARIAEARSAGFVATAHHGDDQLETLLMRLMRGSSLKGMTAMHWRRRLGAGSDGPMLIRPMLRADHEAACAFLRDVGQPWREDHTNADTTRSRARLRSDVLPALKSMNPKAGQGAQRFAEHCQQLARWLHDEAAAAAADETYVKADRDFQTARFTINRVKARELAEPVLSALIRQLLVDAGVPADQLPQRLIERIAAAVRDKEGGERRFELAGNHLLLITRDRVAIGPQGGADSL